MTTTTTNKPSSSSAKSAAATRKEITLEAVAAVAAVTADIINKRVRNLRKKQKRIAQIEESVAQGKSINKEQEEALELKKDVCLMIDELEKLRDPLAAAVSDEVKLVLQRRKHRDNFTDAAAAAAGIASINLASAAHQ